MKILFVSHLNPFKPAGGDAQRVALFLQACCKFADKVDLIAFADNVESDIPDCEVVYSGRLAEVITDKRKQLWGRSADSLFARNQSMARIVKDCLENDSYDFIAVKYIPNAFKYGLMDYADRLIVDVDDHPADEFMVFARQSSTLISKMRKYALSKKARILVPSILDKVRYSFFANPNQVIDNGHCSYLPNIPYHVEKCSPADFKKAGESILFVGDLNYSPNYLGVNHFVKNIFPIIKSRVPGCTFLIAGNLKNETLKRSWSETDGVRVLGFVKDLHEAYESCRVVVAPVYHGGGSNIKVLEALGMGRACVTTSYSISAFKDQLTDKDLCIASDDLSFAGYAIRLLTDEEFNLRLASRGCESVNKFFSSEAFDNIIKKALI